MKKYQVIGGQYESCWYGESDSLLAAKRLATANEEYWDNWQGWHTPPIYESDAVEIVESRGRILTRNGSMIHVPVGSPSYVKSHGKWEKVDW